MKDEKIKIGDFQCRIIFAKGKGPAIVFLHGFMFTSQIWQDIGLLRILDEKKIPFKAVDMPYGKVSDCIPKSGDPAANIKLAEEIAGEKPLLIGASLGGNIALQYAVVHPVSGLLLVAPVGGLQKELADYYNGLKTKVSIIHGENDNVVSNKEMVELSYRLHAELITYKNAGHPAYKDQPEKFNADVLRLYHEILQK